MDQSRSDVTLSVTDEEMKAIEDLFTRNGWELRHKNKKRRTTTSVRRSAPLPIEDRPEDEEYVNPRTTQNEISSECSDCFLDPCVTFRPNHWLGKGQTACQHNCLLRKEMYGKFWKCLSNQGVWNDGRYLIKKQCIGGGDSERSCQVAS